MDRNTLFRVWPAILDPSLCELIKVLGERLTTVPARVSAGHGHEEYDERSRRTQVGFWDERHWINGLLWHFAALANAELWRFDIAFCGGVQFGTYDEGDFFEWHKDEFGMPYNDLAPRHWVG